MIHEPQPKWYAVLDNCAIFFCSLIAVYALLWVGHAFGYDRAVNTHYEYPMDAVLEIEPYRGMVLRGTYKDFMSMYRPYSAPEAK